MSTSAGYSGTPLPKKLGLKPGQATAFVGLPPSLKYLAQAAEFGLLARKPDLRAFDEVGTYDVIHAFTKSAGELSSGLPRLRRAIKQDGMIWISWPKKAAGVPTDLTEDVVREVALDIDLVDVKVCAVDEVWSGLKLVIPRDKRTKGTES